MTDARSDRQGFSGSADAYDRHVGRYSRALARELIAFAGVRPGHRALDVGSGPGALAAELASVVGPAAVSAVEPSPPYAEACARRVPGATVHVAPAEALPFEDGSFDVVLSQLVVNFLDDAGLGVSEMRRVTRGGGTVAAAVWDYAEGMTLLRSFWDAARDTDPDGAAALDEGARMRHCDPVALAALWTAGGLAEVEVAPLVVRAGYTDSEDLWAPLAAGVGPAGAYCGSLEEVGRQRLHDRLRSRLGEPIGAFELTARAWAVAGRAYPA